ncbi:MAG: N-acetylmuramoyl-L-alanine amidase [Thermodesulfobacteriota bacterium]|nr:N-acetylmuramoyl-L-alanine amidase [Thermodesulfobacteriota bacterium]
MITKSKRLLHLTVLLILLTFPLSAAASENVVVIDPGHGGSNMGVTLSKGLHEKNVTLIIAKLVKENLANTKNIKVRLTRFSDKVVSSAKRKRLAEKSDVDLFISLHVNAGFGLKAKGYEIYYPSVAVPLIKNNSSMEIVKNMEQNRCFNNSVRFAQIVRKNMGRVFPREGRGLRNAPVLVLESITTPAVLLEMGFATNLDNSPKLKDKKIQKAIADALARSIKKYFSSDGTL